jgi:hypothetical protein
MADTQPLHFRQSPIDEQEEIAHFLEGMAGVAALVGNGDMVKTLQRGAYWLRRCADRTCAQGYIGCSGGRECESDHK